MVSPGSSVRTGAQRTKPERSTTTWITTRATLEWAARLTSPVVSVPTATTVTMATAGTGLTTTAQHGVDGSGAGEADDDRCVGAGDQ